MTVSEERTYDRDTSIAAYEALRDCVLSGSALGGPAGLSLFKREGITAWRSRGKECSVRVERAKDPVPGVVPSISDEIHADIIRVLASLALGSPQEMRA